MATIGELQVQISADITKLKDGVAQVNATLGKMNKVTREAKKELEGISGVFDKFTTAAFKINQVLGVFGKITRAARIYIQVVTAAVDATRNLADGASRLKFDDAVAGARELRDSIFKAAATDVLDSLTSAITRTAQAFDALRPAIEPVISVVGAAISKLMDFGSSTVLAPIESAARVFRGFSELLSGNFIGAVKAIANPFKSASEVIRASTSAIDGNADAIKRWSEEADKQNKIANDAFTAMKTYEDRLNALPAAIGAVQQEQQRMTSGLNEIEKGLIADAQSAELATVPNEVLAKIWKEMFGPLADPALAIHNQRLKDNAKATEEAAKKAKLLKEARAGAVGFGGLDTSGMAASAAEAASALGGIPNSFIAGMSEAQAASLALQQVTTANVALMDDAYTKLGETVRLQNEAARAEMANLASGAAQIGSTFGSIFVGIAQGGDAMASALQAAGRAVIDVIAQSLAAQVAADSASKASAVSSATTKVGANIAVAASGAGAAVAPTPFVGPALAIGAIAAISSLLGGLLSMFHSGGHVSKGNLASMPGMNPDEGLAILQAGEFVLSKKTMSNLGKFHNDGLSISDDPIVSITGKRSSGPISRMDRTPTSIPAPGGPVGEDPSTKPGSTVGQPPSPPSPTTSGEAPLPDEDLPATIGNIDRLLRGGDQSTKLPVPTDVTGGTGGGMSVFISTAVPNTRSQLDRYIDSTLKPALRRRGLA